MPRGRADEGAAKQGDAMQAGDAMAVEERPYSWSDMNLRQKAKHVIANVTVEPITLLYVVPNLLSNITTLNLNLEKACRVNLNYSAELCDSFSQRNFTNETKLMYAEVMKTVSDMQVWQTPLQNSVPILLVLFVGSWSDRRRRRKPFLLSPLLGELFTAVGLLLCSLFYLSWPLEVAGVIEALFPALSGGMTILLLSVFSYVADVTTVETRTFRIGLVSTVVSWGFPIAFALSGVAFTTLGFVGVYILDIVLYVIGITYGFLYIREPHPPVPRPQGVSVAVDFFSWRHVWDTVKVALRKRPGSRQLQLFLVMLLYVTIQGPIQGEGAVGFLYITNRFEWGAIEYSAYGTYSIILGAVGSFVVTTVLNRWLKLDDCIIGMIAMAAKTLSAPGYAFALLDWQLYAVTASDILGAGAVITMRAIASKLVDADELGKLMALLAVVESIIPVVFKPAYSQVYSDTLVTNPGLFFHISGVVSLAGFFLYLAIYMMQKKQARLEAQRAQQKKDDDAVLGVTNTAFQGDHEVRDGARVNGMDNTFL